MSQKPKLELAENAAAAAGAVLLSQFQKDAGIINDLGKDIKTQADKHAEAEIIERLCTTNIPILTEESGAYKEACWNDELWIVDPLDGTFNFVRGLNTCCVSIALWENGHPVLGVIYDFLHGDMYAGEVGQGVEINGGSMGVSGISELGKGALATGFPSDRDYGEHSLKRFVSQIQKFKKIRMLGSAAMSLAHVASGRIEAYQEESIWVWDVAAGLALVLAAGGQYEISVPNNEWKMDVYAHNGKLGNLND